MTPQCDRGEARTLIGASVQQFGVFVSVLLRTIVRVRPADDGQDSDKKMGGKKQRQEPRNGACFENRNIFGIELAKYMLIGQIYAAHITQGSSLPPTYFFHA